jgi:hypothetical protein
MQVLGNVVAITEDVLTTIKQRFSLMNLAKVFFACLFKRYEATPWFFDSSSEYSLGLLVHAGKVQLLYFSNLKSQQHDISIAHDLLQNKVFQPSSCCSLESATVNAQLALQLVAKHPTLVAVFHGFIFQQVIPCDFSIILLKLQKGALQNLAPLIQSLAIAIEVQAQLPFLSPQQLGLLVQYSTANGNSSIQICHLTCNKIQKQPSLHWFYFVSSAR